MARMAKGHGAVVETRELEVGPYRVVLTRKRIKRAYLRVDDAEGPLRVSAPVRMSLDAVRAFVEAQVPWIEQRRALLRAAPPASPRRGHVGADGTVLLWGARRSLAEVAPRVIALLAPYAPSRSRDTDLAAVQDCAVWASIPADVQARVEKLVVAALKDALAAEAQPLVHHYERVMGVSVAEMRYRDMHTRWGTCNVRDHRVWLAVSLAHFSRPCTELIVVHELSHLIETGHGPRFKACMDRFLPDWRDRERLLKHESRGR